VCPEIAILPILPVLQRLGGVALREAVWEGCELGQQRKAKMASENGSQEGVAESASK